MTIEQTLPLHSAATLLQLISSPQLSLLLLSWPSLAPLVPFLLNRNLLINSLKDSDKMLASSLAPASPFHAPSLVYQLVSSPLSLLARFIYQVILRLRPIPKPFLPPIKVVCISDTHTKTRDVPPGDLLIHAGDLCKVGSTTELRAQIAWLDSLPHTHKIVISGNHDGYLDPRSRKMLSSADASGGVDWCSLKYLQHRSTRLEFPKRGGRVLNVYGAPQIPACGGPDNAFQYARGQDAWTDTVPMDTDILVTHTPPKWHLDLPPGLGCEWLLRETRRVLPRLHVCGHIHDDRGMKMLWWDRSQSAYERICQRSTGSWLALLDPRNWFDIAMILASGLKGVIWQRIWGGSAQGTILVNAALISNATGELDNEAIVVEV